MKLETLNDFLNTSDLHTFYPLAFPSSEPCSMLDLTGGTSSRGGVHKLYLRVVTQEAHPSIAINKAHDIKAFLYENVKGAFFDGKEVLNVEADTPEPLFVGEEDGVYLVSWNYTILEG